MSTLCGLLLSLAIAQSTADSNINRLNLGDGCLPLEPLENFSLEEVVAAEEREESVELGDQFCEEKRWYGQSKALGRPNAGWLKNGRQLARSKYVLPQTSDRYGSEELVALLEFAGKEMYSVTGSALAVNDLSQRGGGRIRPHRSHQNGLDVDIGNFYAQEKGFNNKKWQYLDGNNEEELAVNWKFILELQKGPAKVTDIYWNRSNIARMQEFVLDRPDGEEEWKRYGAVLRGRWDHKTHYHVRIAPDTFPDSRNLVSANGEQRSVYRPYSL